MQHVRQTGQECYLVTVAMLSERPIEIIRKEANTIAKLLGVKRGGYMTLVRQARTRQVRRDRIAIWKALAVIFSKRYGTPAFYAPATCGPDELDLTGKGALEVRFVSGAGHAVAFEDGIVFDGCALEPVAYEVWRNWARGYYYTPIRSIAVNRLNVPVRGLDK